MTSQKILISFLNFIHLRLPVSEGKGLSSHLQELFLRGDPGEVGGNAAVWDEGTGKVSNCLNDFHWASFWLSLLGQAEIFFTLFVKSGQPLRVPFSSALASLS